VGSFDDGTVFDSSREVGEPYEFVLGSTRVVPGFNDAVAGLGVGQSRRHTMAPADAYGAPPTAAEARCAALKTAAAAVFASIGGPQECKPALPLRS